MLAIIYHGVSPPPPSFRLLEPANGLACFNKPDIPLMWLSSETFTHGSQTCCCSWSAGWSPGHSSHRLHPEERQLGPSMVCGGESQAYSPCKLFLQVSVSVRILPTSYLNCEPSKASICPLPTALVLGSALWTHCLCYFSLSNHCHRSVCLCLQPPGGSRHCLSQQCWSCRWFCILWALWYGMFLRLESVSLTEWTITDCILRSILSTADV